VGMVRGNASRRPGAPNDTAYLLEWDWIFVLYLTAWRFNGAKSLAMFEGIAGCKIPWDFDAFRVL
jgi:hypothetical protein